MQISWMRNHLKPIVNNELQLLYLCHLLGPLINRVYTEKPSLITEVWEDVFDIELSYSQLLYIL